MKYVLFYHSLLSDWNHGNAHFLRGVVTELLKRGHEVEIYEPYDAWSLQNLMKDHGTAPLREFEEYYPNLKSIRYHKKAMKLDKVLKGADVVLMHEWNDADLVEAVGNHRAIQGDYVLLFHDTHHRSVTKPKEMKKYNLRHYDGVLAFGDVIRDIYIENGWTKQAWTWHEAADANLFKPLQAEEKEGDLVWIGNWGDDERTKELHEFLLEPVQELGLKAKVYGVRYPKKALKALEEAGIEYGGWLPNYKVPETFAKYRMTVHVPRGPYVKNLLGIPTIRPFEAMACGIPLLSSPWKDEENLFRPGLDFLYANDGAKMKTLMKKVLNDEQLANSLSESGQESIRERHTCSHRVDELTEMVESCRKVKYVPRPKAINFSPE